MRLQDLGAIGDLIGGVAVVVSLIYLAYQIRQNSKQIEQNSRHVEASMYHATNDAFNRWFALIAQDADLAALWHRTAAGEALKDEELMRVHALLSMLFLSYENNFQQIRLGSVTRETFEIARPAIAAVMSRPVVQAWWKRQGAQLLTPEFRLAIQALVSEANLARNAPPAVRGDEGTPAEA
jgi:hypothetical protein